MGQAIESLSAVAQSLAAGEGAIGELLDPEGAGRQAVVDLRDSAASIKRIAARLEDPEGLVGRLLNDPESGAMADDLQATLADLAEIIQEVPGQFAVIIGTFQVDRAADAQQHPPSRSACGLTRAWPSSC